MLDVSDFVNEVKRDSEQRQIIKENNSILFKIIIPLIYLFILHLLWLFYDFIFLMSFVFIQKHAKKGVLAKKWAINKIICFHSKIVLLVLPEILANLFNAKNMVYIYHHKISFRSVNWFDLLYSCQEIHESITGWNMPPGTQLWDYGRLR